MQRILAIAALPAAALILAACSGEGSSGASQPSSRPLAVGDVWTWKAADGTERRLMIVARLGNEYEVHTILGETSAAIMSGRHIDETVQTRIGRAASSLRNTVWQLRPDPLGVPLTGLRDVQMPKADGGAPGAPAVLGRRPQDLADGVRAYPSRGPHKYQSPKKKDEDDSEPKKDNGPDPGYEELTAAARTTELVEHDPVLRWRGNPFESVDALVDAVHKSCATTRCQIAILGNAPQADLAKLADAFLERDLKACVATDPARPRPWRTGQVWAMPTMEAGVTVEYTVEGVHEKLFGGSHARLSYRRKTSANIPDALRTLTLEQNLPEGAHTPKLVRENLEVEPVTIEQGRGATEVVADADFAREVADWVHQLETDGRVAIPVRVRQKDGEIVATMSSSSRDMTMRDLEIGVQSASAFPFPIVFEVRAPEVDRELLYPVLALIDAGVTPWRLGKNTPEPSQTAAPGSPSLAVGQVWTWQHSDGNEDRLTIVGRVSNDFVVEIAPDVGSLRLRLTEWNLGRTVRQLVGFRRASTPGAPAMIEAPISAPLALWDPSTGSALRASVTTGTGGDPASAVVIEQELPEAKVTVERARASAGGTWRWRSQDFPSPGELARAVRSADVPVQLVLLGDGATLEQARALTDSDVGAVLAPAGSDVAIAAGDVWSLELADEGVSVELEVVAVGADVLVGPTVDLRPLPIEGVGRSRITHIRAPAKALVDAGARKTRSVAPGERLADEVLEGPLRSREPSAQLRESVAVYAQLVLHGEARPVVTLAMTEGGLVARLFGIDSAAAATPNYMASLGDKVDYPMVYQIDPGTVPDAEVRVFLDRLAEFGVQFALKK